MNEEEIIKKANELLTRVMSGYGLAKVDKIHLVLQGLLDLYNKEKEKNNNLIHELRIYQNETISKNKIREIFDNYSQSSLMENNTFLEFKKELLEERN